MYTNYEQSHNIFDETIHIRHLSLTIALQMRGRCSFAGRDCRGESCSVNILLLGETKAEDMSETSSHLYVLDFGSLKYH